MDGTRIYITGFMTSGKSTIGPILANVLGMGFYDLDKEIEQKEKATVVEIFEKKGEQYFRNLEKEMIKSLNTKGNIIVALGGGTITFQENLDMLKKSGIIVYLKVSPNILYLRLKNKTNRPLFRDLVLGENGQADFMKRINDMLDKRKQYYEQAHIIITTDNNPIGLTVDILAKKIKKVLHEKN